MTGMSFQRPGRLDKTGWIGLILLGAIVLSAVFAPWLSPYPPGLQLSDGLDADGAPLPPCWRFPLGTDLLGRDVLSRLLWGGRDALLIGGVANTVAVMTGTLIGMCAAMATGRVGCWIGAGLMRLTDLVASIPVLLLAVTVSAVLRPSIWVVMLVVALAGWAPVARVIYVETSGLSARLHVRAARALGVGWGRIVLRHILPLLGPVIVVWGTLGIAGSVLLEATLSYLGAGVQPPEASWGSIINENQAYLLIAPWLVFAPGGAILLLAVGANLTGSALKRRWMPGATELDAL
ncbi:Amide-urea transport system permease protein [Granulibacter bethesdensis]|nr:Amide-urea transport system permease protein [Granulibacter bethesdensis]